MRVAEGRRLGDPETIHYGLVPRSNRGIIAINELPDLAERIQVEAYEIPDRLRDQVKLRDATCVFPHCTRRAAHCDLVAQ